jgi:hypothetical protein
MLLLPQWAVRWWGRGILFLELFYFLFWFSSMFVVVGRVDPLPVGPLLPGLSSSAYDATSDYRLSHYKLFAHFFSPAATFQLLTGMHTEVTPWFWLIISMVIGTDTFSTMENYLHLSRVEHPDFYTLEVILSISALSLSVTTMLWYTVLYVEHVYAKRMKAAAAAVAGGGDEERHHLSGFMMAAGYAVCDTKTE